MRRAGLVNKTIYKHLEEHQSIYIFSGILLTMGVIFGAIVVNSLNFTQKNDLYAYLSLFFGQVQRGEFAGARDMFVHSFVHYLKYVGLMWLLGLSIIGLPIVFILLFIKGLVVGFTVGFLVNQMGFNGFILSFVSILPQNIILIPIFIVIATAAISFSLRLWRQVTRRVHQPIMQYFVRYGIVLIFAILLIATVSFYEAFISPTIMKAIYGWIG